MIKAKGKLRREKLDAEAEVLKKHEESMLKSVVKSPKETKARDEAEGYEVVAIFAAEIQEIYAEEGFQLDDVNAEDKALIIWRDLHYNNHIRTHHREIPHKLCQEHS